VTDELWQHPLMRRVASTLVFLLVIAACGDSSEPEATVVDIDWEPRIEATRALHPVEVELLVLVEVNEELEAGHLLSGRFDADAQLADLVNASPITSNLRNRIIVSGDDAYLLTAVDSVITALPEGAEIIHADLATFDSLGVATLDVQTLTGALGLLGGATENRQVGTSVFEADLDVDLAVAALSEAERRAVPFTLEGIDETIGLAEVTLSPDGTTIQRLRVRINGSGGAGGAGEVLLTVDYRITPFATELTFTPPPSESVVELSDHPQIVSPIADLGPGF